MTYFSENSLFVIAEAGKNFIYKNPLFGITTEECLERAKELVDKAKELDVSAIKFQTHVFEDEKEMRDESRFSWIQTNEELTPYDKFWKPLKEHCDTKGILFMTTPMSRLAAEKVNDLVKVWKIGSGNVTDYKLLEYIAQTKKPVILSTGMNTLEEIDKAVEILKGNDELALLHCVSIYPCPVNKCNLGTIDLLKERYNIVKRIIGYSDHTVDSVIPAKAVEYGARIIEKHFTLNNNDWGPDHKFSMNPLEFRAVVNNLQVAMVDHLSYGNKYEKVINQEELELRKKFVK